MIRFKVWDWKQRIDEILKDNICSPELNVTRLSDLLLTSEQHVYKLMFQLYGDAPHKILESFRLLHAINLIDRDPGVNLFRVAILCGFGNYNTFRRSFKRRLNISPSAYVTMPASYRILVKKSLFPSLTESDSSHMYPEMFFSSQPLQ